MVVLHSQASHATLTTVLLNCFNVQWVHLQKKAKETGILVNCIFELVALKKIFSF